MSDPSKPTVPEPADFYLGRGLDGEYLGSLLTAGAPEDVDIWIRFQSRTDENYTERDYREEVRDLIREARTTKLNQPTGKPTWPWRYGSSSETPWAYVFEAGTVYLYRYGVEMSVIRCNYTRPGPGGVREPRRPQSHAPLFPPMTQNKPLQPTWSK